MKLVLPSSGEKAYSIACDEFVSFYRQVTGCELKTVAATDDFICGDDCIVIGSDAVNHFTHRLIRERVISGLEIRMGSDDYRLLSVRYDQKDVLVIYGGCGRSTLYAVYDFFRIRGNVEYFWDGDIFHRKGELDITNLNVTRKPHFRYRGLRYFAHRGTHRFHAEHWSWEDWKKELHYLVKNRFNLFMLRIGQDDLFQRAFGLPYPPEDRRDPDFEKDANSGSAMGDRTSAWGLKYRGELREKILAYSRDLGLIHPDDCGTMTHWYSPTPNSFFDKYHDTPLLGGQTTNWYATKGTAVWDINQDVAMDRYWELTKAHIREYGGGTPRMFHTIGLAERLYGKTKEENLQLKLYTYRRIQQWIRKEYPDTPLMLAGWDLMMWWNPNDVAKLCDELDPEKTIIFDYNTDQLGRNTYRECGLYKRFPWIYGFLFEFAFNNCIQGDYKALLERLGEAASDEKCLGFLLWPEISHTDTFMLEFLASRSWSPERLSVSQLCSDFCAKRYTSHNTEWNEIWKNTLRITAYMNWGIGEWPVSHEDLDYHCRLLESDKYSTLTPERIAYFRSYTASAMPDFSYAESVFENILKILPEVYGAEQCRRDMIDVTRSIMNFGLRMMFMSYSVMLEEWRSERKTVSEIRALEAVIRRTYNLLADILEQNDDFSSRIAFNKLKTVHSVNPDFEKVMMGNMSSSYCRNQNCEMARYVYLPEMECYFAKKNAKLDSGALTGFKFEEDEKLAGSAIVAGFFSLPVSQAREKIMAEFNAMKFSDMKFKNPQSMENLKDIITQVQSCVREYLGRI